MTQFDENWQDCGSYWLHLHPQLTSRWKEERLGRLTSTSFSALANPSFLRGHDDILDKYRGVAATPSLHLQIASKFGLKNEPDARDWYRRVYQVEVKEVGLIVPKWDTRIGTSLDGEVGQDGMVEFKCPQKMYYNLIRHCENKRKGWKPSRGYHGHIYDSHYDQMQSGMAMAGKKWCDYVVFSPNDQLVFVERIYFDRRYWEDILYPAAKAFLEEHPDLFVSHEN